MTETLKAVLYMNQFFGGIGGEDKAGIEPLAKAGAIGPGLLFREFLDPHVEITATVICGDNYFCERMDDAGEAVFLLIEGYAPDLVLAGPAFNAGRYGMACGAVCASVTRRMAIPAVTGMYPHNPGVEAFRKDIYIVETKGSVAGMRDGVASMSRLALKLARGEPIGTPEEEGYIPRGLRRNYFASETGASRAVTSLLNKLKGKSFITEYAMPVFDRVKPVLPVKSTGEITIALITSGGIVPKGNPDRVESSSATRYGRYDINGLARLAPETHETVHGGYDQTYANEDPNRVLPLDAVRDLEREGRIGRLYPYYYATVGNGTSVANAGRFAREIARELVRDGVQAVIITST